MNARQAYTRAHRLYREYQSYDELERRAPGAHNAMIRMVRRAKTDVLNELEALPAAPRAAALSELMARTEIPAQNSIGAWQIHSANTPINRLREVSIEGTEYRCFWDGAQLRRRPLNGFEQMLKAKAS